jgi:hypothetical protein
MDRATPMGGSRAATGATPLSAKVASPALRRARRLPSRDLIWLKAGVCARRRMAEWQVPHITSADGVAPVSFDRELIRKYDGLGPRYTSYPTADRFTGSGLEQTAAMLPPSVTIKRGRSR